MTWQWQDDARWHSCSAEAQARAASWLADGEALQLRIDALAAQQPLLSATPQHLAEWRAHAASLRALSSQLVVIGTGGASLGAQTLCMLADEPTRVRFFENCDPATATNYSRYALEDTAWVIISKSGETVETLSGALSLVGQYSSAPSLLRERVRVVTSNKQSTLGMLAASQGWEVLEHPAELGGRFSVFSVVGLLPAAYAGLDIDAIAGAAQDAFANPGAELLAHAAWLAATAQEKPIHVLMAYADRLRPATQWHKQLWAESLGKGGQGSTPVTAIGAIDQHSQLQLYLDGPRDKVMTLFLPQVAGQGTALPKLDIPGLQYLAGHRMGDVMQATAEATVKTLLKAEVPLRVLRGVLTPASLAAWMARQMLETIAVAALLEVDPYSQPAVEEGKTLTRAALRSA